METIGFLTSTLIIVETLAVILMNNARIWEIELKNWNNTISAWWPTRSKNEIRLDKKRKNYTLKIEPSLRGLKEVIQEIETVLETKFDGTIYSKRFKGKIKNKNAAQKWLLDKYTITNHMYRQ